MKLLIIVFLLLLSTCIKSYSQLDIKGSFVVAAKAKDGIMVACDSRGVFIDKKSTITTPIIFGYFDNCKKMFVTQHNKIIVCTGYLSIGSYTISNILYRFDSLHTQNISVKDYIPEFLNFIKTLVSSDVYNNFYSCESIVVAGYENSIPVICQWDVLQGKGCGSKDSMFVASGGPISFSEKYRSFFSCSQLEPLAARAIYKYATDNKKTIQIGGKIVFCRITALSIAFRNDKNLKQWKTTEELIKSAISNKIKVHYTSAKNKEKVYHMLD